MIKEGENKYICPDLQFLRNYFIQVIYELITEALPDKDVRQFFGYTFARYVNRLLSACSPTSSILARTFYSDVGYEQDKNAEACDGLLHWPSAAVMMEYKAGILTTRQRYSMIPAEIMRGIDSLMNKGGKKPKGVVQLAKNLGRVIAGQKLKSQQDVIDLSACEIIYPAIVIYDEMLMNHGVRLYLQNELNRNFDEQGTDKSRIGPLLLFSIRDIEHFEVLVEKVGAEKLIREYAAAIERNDRDPDIVFHIYALSAYPESARREGIVEGTINKHLRRVIDDIEQKRRDRAET